MPGRRDIVIFQSTLPHGERRTLQTRIRGNNAISIHAPAWGATIGDEKIKRVKKHFNPRSRMGSDNDITGYVSARLISIHAPAWGATIHIIHFGMSFLISIHAPAWGATVHRFDEMQEIMISIHAPAWGATFPVRFTGESFRFQSTLPHGERQQKHEISSLFL